MRKSICSALMALALAGCSSDDTVNEPIENPPADDPKDAVEWTYIDRMDLSSSESDAVAGINSFSYALMREMSAASSDGSFGLSPVSVAIYFSMLANATSGDVNAQILQTLGSPDIKTLNSICEKFMRYLPYDRNGSSISISNRFWVADAYKVPEAFSEVMAASFNAGVESVDFTVPATVPAINKWVEENTYGLISSLLDGDWKDYVSIPMANANIVYFKGYWQNKFDSKDTRTEKFQSPDGPMDVRMMHNFIRTGYASTDLTEMVCLDFEGPMNNMYLYLPAEGISIQQLLTALTPETDAALRKAAETYAITLGLPRFEMHTDSDMTPILSSLGVSSIYAADFSPMGLGTHPVSALHKTSMKIDEKGAEMAALTGGWLGLGGPDGNGLRNVTIDFNRPFVYIVRNSDSGAILMAGAVTRP